MCWLDFQSQQEYFYSPMSGMLVHHKGKHEFKGNFRKFKEGLKGQKSFEKPPDS